jgi:hypothetical protein
MRKMTSAHFILRTMKDQAKTKNHQATMNAMMTEYCSRKPDGARCVDAQTWPPLGTLHGM